MWQVFHILTEPDPYTFVFANRRNNETWVVMSARASLFRRFADTVPLICGKLAAKFP